MSAEPDEGRKVPGLIRLGEDSEGRTMLGVPYDESMASESFKSRLQTKVSPMDDQDGDDTEGTTENPSSTEGRGVDEAGPIRRFNSVFTDLGHTQLEALGLDGFEVSSSISTLRDEMYRSRFPIISPRFGAKCVDDDCQAEYDRDIDFCIQCARLEMMEDGERNPPTNPDDIPEEYRDHPVRAPDITQKRELQRLSESVNKEGQSLRELMKQLEDDQGRLGVSVMVVRKNYSVAVGDTIGYNRGDVIHEEVDEIVRGDPKRIVPVVDDDGRVGGYKWTCPVHREDALTENDDYEDGDTECEEGGAELREVYFVERSVERGRTESAEEKYFFSDEVITWARYYPRLHGLDGLSPVHHIWLKQAILHWMDIYGSAFYDPDSENYPNKFMVVHTTNPQAWEKQFEKAEEDAKENLYSEQIMYNEYSGESNSTPEVQVIDLMQDDLIGQNDTIRDQYKQDIRTQFGVANVFENDLKDAGGLNNEGLQMEVTDRSVATAMRDTASGPLDELAKVLGATDYQFDFIPGEDIEADSLRDRIDTGKEAVDAGLEARLEDGELKVSDGEFEESDDGGGGGLADLFADFEGEPPVETKADTDSLSSGDYVELHDGNDGVVKERREDTIIVDVFGGGDEKYFHDSVVEHRNQSGGRYGGE